MDHLPCCFPNFRQIKVQYLHDTEKDYVYDNKPPTDMPMYPNRHGWLILQLVRDDGDFTNDRQDSLEQAASMLQAWLYFGLIHVFTGMPVTTSDYVRLTNENEYLITTEKLPQHIAAWRRSMIQLSENLRARRISAIDGFLEKKVDVLYKGCVRWQSPVPTEVLFSMIVLHKTLVYAKLSLVPSSVEPAEEWYGETNRFIRTRLIANGWCPRDAYRLRQKLSSLAQYYVLTLGRHESAHNHDKCTNTVCEALQVDEANYKIKHTNCPGDCDLVSLDSSQLSSVVQRGDIPTVTFSDPSGLRIQSINPKSPHDEGKYVAISHIWADGLGNPTKNAMPQCQLKLLQARVNALYTTETPQIESPRALWMDTLCVPAGPGSSEAKSLAINSMAAIYKRADKVLVLDSDLRTIKSDAPPIEIAIRIAISSWWTRLWVLQESMFARELWFQLEDKAVNEAIIRERSKKLETNPGIDDWSITQSITAEALSHISSLDTIYRSAAEDDGRHLLSNITWRFTTRKSDEAVCLAILLGLPAEVLTNIQAIPDDQPIERMKAWILAQKAFPSLALFWNSDTPGRINEPGFRWASMAFVGRQSDQTTYILRDPNLYRRMPTKPDTSFADTHGLHVQYPGLALILPAGFLVLPGPPTRLPVINQSDNGYYDIYLAVPPTSPITWDSLRDTRGLAAVLPRPLAVNDKDRVLQGVLVAECEEREGEMFTRYVCVLEVRLRYLPINEGDRQQLGTCCPTAVSLGVNQGWCVG